MTKFIINKIIIEKSDKDIKTDCTYEFNDTLNLICGNNEAGKSSLMKFIKDAFFRPSKIDTGKIFFSVDNKHLRADIKNSAKRADRCKLFDNSGIEFEYEFFEKFINQKYFQQGFTINLDDLMTLKYDNETTLINTIKDPSGDKLNILLQPLSSKISDCIGDKGRTKKPINEITAKISELNNKINELSNKENDYIGIISQIKHYNEELQICNTKEHYVNSLIKKRDNDKKINEINLQIKEKNSAFNNKVYDAVEEYTELAANIGKYESNSSTVSRIKQKLENTENKIQEYENILQNNFSISADRNKFLNFEINYEKINKIKSLLEEINEEKAEIKAYEKNIENIKENLLKLENDYEFIKNNIKNLSIDEITNLFSFIDEGLKQIESIRYDINEFEKEKNSKKSSTIFEMIFFVSTAVISLISSVIFFNLDKVIYAGIFLGLFILLICLMFKRREKTSLKEQIVRKQNLKNNIIKELCIKTQTCYPDISSKDDFIAVSILEKIRQELKINIDKITQNNIDSQFNKTKIKNTEEKISELTAKIQENEQTIQELIENNITSDSKTYPEAVNIIKELKNLLLNKTEMQNELQSLEDCNNSIIDKFNCFLKEKEISIPLSSNLKLNFEELTKYREHNNNIKKELDALSILIENIKEEEIQTEKNENYKAITVFSDLEYLLNENEIKKREISELKHSLEVQKSLLEEVASIIDIKNEKNIIVNEYRNLIKELITAQAVINITTKAKNNFDKTQPDLVNAQKYLSLLTNGKYSNINLELQEIANAEQTVTKKWNELSRGTKEQLYLALRLGYASNYALKDSKRPNLPLIIDDAFVNFDPERTKCALNCLIEFAKTNQILFFTCHSETIKKHLESLGYSENTKIINI